MGLLSIEGMKFFSYHGFYPEEQLIGSEYIVDIYITLDMIKVSESDDLTDTVNYETVYRIVKTEMAKKSKLIETVAYRIINRIKTHYNFIESLKVKISKLNPPLAGTVEKTYTEIEENYRKNCAKCNADILVQVDGNCWTEFGKIYIETMNTLKRNYGNNLCKRCIEPYIIVPKSN